MFYIVKVEDLCVCVWFLPLHSLFQGQEDILLFSHSSFMVLFSILGILMYWNVFLV